MKRLKVLIKELMYFFFKKVPLIIIGKFKGNLIFTHWGRGLNNFGDCLSPIILKHYGFTPVYSQINKSDIILAGTILQWIPNDFNGIILGSGSDNLILEFPKARILGVRGVNTKNNIKSIIHEDILLGDPGLIMNYIFPNKTKKKYELGIVPHFVDKNHHIIKEYLNQFKDNCLIIDVFQKPEIVIDNIKKCKYIISSSLHGLIIADAFYIPNVRFVIRETMPTEFYDFKFADYYSALNIDLYTIEVNGSETLNFFINRTRIHKKEIIELQIKLDNTFRNLKNSLK